MSAAAISRERLRRSQERSQQLTLGRPQFMFAPVGPSGGMFAPGLGGPSAMQGVAMVGGLGGALLGGLLGAARAAEAAVDGQRAGTTHRSAAELLFSSAIQGAMGGAAMGVALGAALDGSAPSSTLPRDDDEDDDGGGRDGRGGGRIDVLDDIMRLLERLRTSAERAAGELPSVATAATIAALPTHAYVPGEAIIGGMEEGGEVACCICLETLKVRVHARTCTPPCACARMGLASCVRGVCGRMGMWMCLQRTHACCLCLAPLPPPPPPPHPHPPPPPPRNNQPQDEHSPLHLPKVDYSPLGYAS